MSACTICEQHTESILRVEGLCCHTEAATLEQRLLRVGGVHRLTTDVVGQRLRVAYDAARTTTAMIAEAVAETGMRAWIDQDRVSATIQPIMPMAPPSPHHRQAHASPSPRSHWHATLLRVAAIALGLGLALHALGRVAAADGRPDCPGVVVSGGVTTVRRALLAIRNRTLDMYVLMLVAVIGAALIGEWFEAATVVVLFSFAQVPRYPRLRAGRQGQEARPPRLHTSDVHLDDCRVPGACLLGGKEKLDERLARVREGKKAKSQAAMQTFEASRPTVGAQALGIARAAYEYALDYAKEREQFGKKIIENQAIAFALADMKIEIDAARLLVWRAAWMGRNGRAVRERRGLDVQAEGRRGRRLGDRAGHPDPRRQRLHPRVPGRADAPRREDLHHLRGHQRDPAPGHRPRDLGHPHQITNLRRESKGRPSAGPCRLPGSGDDFLRGAEVHARGDGNRDLQRDAQPDWEFPPVGAEVPCPCLTARGSGRIAFPWRSLAQASESGSRKGRRRCVHLGFSARCPQ